MLGNVLDVRNTFNDAFRLSSFSFVKPISIYMKSRVAKADEVEYKIQSKTIFVGSHRRFSAHCFWLYFLVRPVTKLFLDILQNYKERVEDAKRCPNNLFLCIQHLRRYRRWSGRLKSAKDAKY